MAYIKFGSTGFTKVTKGSLGGKFVIPSRIITIKTQIPKIKLKLSIKKEELLKKHSIHHTKRHMNHMRQLMIMGTSFKDAHQKANQFIGR